MFTMTSVRWQKSHPYRNEMMRLLLHSFYAIKVSFFYTNAKACNASDIMEKKGEEIC